MGSVIDHVLTMEEVRQSMKAVASAALHQGAVVHFGERGADQLVIVARERWDAVVAERAQAPIAAPGAYAAFSRGFDQQRAGHQPSAESRVTPRRRAPEQNEVSTVTLSQMLEAGRDQRAPVRRRPAADVSAAHEA